MLATTIVLLAVTVAAKFEGLRLQTYYDPVGVPTVCYGSRAEASKNGLQIKHTQTSCMDKLRLDMSMAFGAVRSCQGDQLPESVAAAFTSAVFNMGSRVACASTAATLLKQKNTKLRVNNWLCGIRRKLAAQFECCADLLPAVLLNQSCVCETLLSKKL